MDTVHCWRLKLETSSATKGQHLPAAARRQVPTAPPGCVAAPPRRRAASPAERYTLECPPWRGRGRPPAAALRSPSPVGLHRLETRGRRASRRATAAPQPAGIAHGNQFYDESNRHEIALKICSCCSNWHRFERLEDRATRGQCSPTRSSFILLPERTLCCAVLCCSDCRTVQCVMF